MCLIGRGQRSPLNPEPSAVLNSTIQAPNHALLQLEAYAYNGPAPRLLTDLGRILEVRLNDSSTFVKEPEQFRVAPIKDG